VFVLEGNNSNLDRALAAFAAGRKELDQVDFAILDLKELRPLSLELSEVKGNTPDVEVNSWHRDIVHLTASKIVALAVNFQGKARFYRKRSTTVRELIKAGISAGHIDETRLTTKLREKLE
jgi:hypothetical protein